jgi:hypothetical protein
MPVGWTHLLAGAAAHDINNLAHSLSSLLALASDPNVSKAALDEYRAMAHEALAALRRLGAEMHALGSAAPGPIATAPQSLRLACEDALAETEPRNGQRLIAGPMPGDAFVRGSTAALRVLVKALLRHALAASPAGAVVRLDGSSNDGTTSLRVVARGASPPGIDERLSLGAWLDGAGRSYRGSFHLVLAGALAAELGGEIDIGPGGAADAGDGDGRAGAGRGIAIELRIPLAT